ncbi:SMP-30/gluconolactonase/LRE family protein [bacterium]|nr:SMP-30/gluconolactonase/LRE family protein [bacterium]
MRGEIAADFPCACGEGPLWHPEQGGLYWIDVDEGNMFCYLPEKRQAKRVYRGEIIGGLTLQADGQLLLFMNRGAIALWSPKAGLRVQRRSTPGVEQTRFNDVIADPEGRVFAGSMPSETESGRVYRLDPDGSIRVVLEEAGQPNGMAFSPDGRFFYLTDTQAGTIKRFEYCREDGQIQRPVVLIEAQAGEGQPDGLTVDREGCLWSARWDGASLRRYDPDGTLLEVIPIEARNVTSMVFVKESLYVTTAGGADRPQAGIRAGSLFRVEAGVSAPAEFRSRISF